MTDRPIRQSIEPTYDSRETGDRYHVTTRLGDHTVVTDDLSTRLLAAINTASRDSLGAYIQTFVAIHEDAASARSPGWYEAHCDCGWLTSGREPHVEEEAESHVLDKHPPLITRLCQAHREIVEHWQATKDALGAAESRKERRKRLGLHWWQRSRP